MSERRIAIEAIAECYHVLTLLARVDNDRRWTTGSVPLCKLERLARELGYESLEFLCLEVFDQKFDEDNMW